ncbi:MAG TPA: hypothetical protein VFQ53_17515 [Kofleriaceae bacterium]|nr:hypothetical protein [Kofleriaceae bacterium]
MKALVFLLVILVAAPVAHAQPDTAGWTFLGVTTVEGRRDHDTVTVGRYEGRFDQLMLVVTDSDLELRDMTVVFANGERWSPALSHVFREGQRSRAIDLPRGDRAIARIELSYANLPGGGKASVQVYGRDQAKPVPAPPKPAPPAFDARGWTLLGKQTVDGKRDRDVIRVGRYRGRFDQLTVVAKDSDLDLLELTIVFANRTRWSPKLRHQFKEGQRSRVIDLPGSDRVIAQIEVAYANLPGGGRAALEVYARDTGATKPAPIAPVTWDRRGWTLLGKKTVDGWRDRDRLVVTNATPFAELVFVVAGNDIEIFDIDIVVGNGSKLSPKTRHSFKEGTRTHPIDIPGPPRRIRAIDFAWGNLGRGRALVEIWARRKPAPPIVRDHR